MKYKSFGTLINLETNLIFILGQNEVNHPLKALPLENRLSHDSRDSLFVKNGVTVQKIWPFENYVAIASQWESNEFSFQKTNLDIQKTNLDIRKRI